MANLRIAQKELTRQRLLDTALELFESKGYAATTIDDIAAAAGTTRVTFYAHFPSRRAIMAALIAQLNLLLERRESSAHGSTASALVDAVHAGTSEALGGWLRTQSARWPVIRPYILSADVAASVEPEIRELVDEWSEEVVGDILDGLNLANRFDPATRHFRGVLAFEMLDRSNLHWIRHQWDLETDPALDVLAEAWVKLLGDAQ
jgi:AcrR family transcriptional regulator